MALRRNKHTTPASTNVQQEKTACQSTINYVLQTTTCQIPTCKLIYNKYNACIYPSMILGYKMYKTKYDNIYITMYQPTYMLHVLILLNLSLSLTQQLKKYGSKSGKTNHIIICIMYKLLQWFII